MKLGFTGTQSGMNSFQSHEVKKLFNLLDPDEFHHGDCIGADTEAHWMFIYYHIENNTKERKIVVHPPTNDGKASFLWVIDKWPAHIKEKLRNCQFKLLIETREPFAYLLRNQDIVRETEKLVATPKEMEHTLRSGTWATVRFGWKQKKEVIVIPPIVVIKS